ARKAMEACVLCNSGCSPRAVRHTSHPQFHCGTPPPAAAPRTTTRSMNRLLATQFEQRAMRCAQILLRPDLCRADITKVDFHPTASLRPGLRHGQKAHL